MNFLWIDKMADNVMALVKKKGPQKKPRGKAAQRQKAKAAAGIARPKRVPNKRYPFKPFIYMEPSEMIEEIDNFIASAGWTQDRKIPDPNLDREMVRMFNILKTGIPFPLVKTFFIDFFESGSYNVVRYFEEFKQRPDVSARIENMKNIIKNRQATPLKIPQNVLIQKGIAMGSAERQYKQAKMVAKEKGRLRERAISPTQRPKTMFGPDDILSQCEREYRRAPWMFPFSDQVIRGFALKNVDPTYTIPQEVKDGWYKVNMAWYRMACEGKRKFVPGEVAYVTVNNDLIIETEEMYKASKQDWIREFTPLDITSFDVAKRMLMDNDVLKSVYGANKNALEDYAKAIIASFGPVETNYDLARKISYVLVFLSSLINEPQIYHERIRAQEYPADVLINLDRYTLLPEVFRDPNVDKTPIENKIKRARRSIENKYYELIKQSDPVVRRLMKPRPVEVPRKSIGQISVDERVALPAVLPAAAIVSVKTARAGKELAPGLFQKLRERITQMTPIYCNQCDAEVFAPPYTTPRGAERLKFCSKECFDRYDI
jgi:hypothetical protein